MVLTSAPLAAGTGSQLKSGIVRVAQYQSARNMACATCAAGPSMRTWVSRQ